MHEPNLSRVPDDGPRMTEGSRGEVVEREDAPAEESARHARVGAVVGSIALGAVGLVRAGLGRVSWSTRVKMAVVLSFCLLIGAPLISKLRGPGGDNPSPDPAGSKAPTLAIQGTSDASPEGNVSGAGPGDTTDVTAEVIPVSASAGTAMRAVQPIGANVVDATETTAGVTPLAPSSGHSATPPEPAVVEEYRLPLTSRTGPTTPPDPTQSIDVEDSESIASNRPSTPPMPEEGVEDLSLELPATRVAAPPTLGELETPGELEVQDVAQAPANSGAATQSGLRSASPLDVTDAQPSSSEVGETAQATTPVRIPPKLNETRALPVASAPVVDSTTSRARPEPAPSAVAGASAPGSTGVGSQGIAGATIEPVAHVVRRGENFWTIARHYYGSGRYYRALWRANREQVPEIEELYIGSSIIVPAPEDLDRAYIDPPSAARAAERNRSLSRREEGTPRRN